LSNVLGELSDHLMGKQEGSNNAGVSLEHLRCELSLPVARQLPAYTKAS
jgi:hypothetical protein